MSGLHHKILFILLMFSLQGFGQSVITNYTKDNSLTSNMIICYLVDSRGIVWLGTDKGLSIFTGSNWSAITRIEDRASGKKVALNQVKAIYEDSQGYIWVSSENGIFCYLGTYWINFLNKTDDEGYVSQKFYEDGYGKVLALLESRRDLKEGIGIVVLSGSVQVFDENENFSFDEHVAGSFFDKYLDNDFSFFNDFLVDQSDHLWLSSNNGLYRMKGDEWEKFEQADIGCKRTFDMVEDSAGNVWIGTDNGVVEFQNGKWTEFGKKEGLNSKEIHKIAIDSMGRIWAYNPDELKSSGVYMYNGKKWVSYTKKQMHLKGTIEGLLFAENEVIALTGKSVSHFNNGKWKAYEKKSGLKEAKYELMCKDKLGRIWLAGDHGLYLKTDEKWKVAFQTEKDLDIEIIYFDHNNSCWIGTGKEGIYHQTENNEWVRFSEENGLVNNTIKEIFEDNQNNLWVVTRKGVSAIAN